jgi:hypothetical protein
LVVASRNNLALQKSEIIKEILSIEDLKVLSLKDLGYGFVLWLLAFLFGFLMKRDFTRTS